MHKIYVDGSGVNLHGLIGISSVFDKIAYKFDQDLHMSVVFLDDNPTASACARSSLPLRNARFVNSPGSASRAPHFTTKSKTAVHE